jgi:hypothetical protein
MRLPILALACVALAVSLSTAQHAPGLDAGPPDAGAGSAEDLRRLTDEVRELRRQLEREARD